MKYYLKLKESGKTKEITELEARYHLAKQFNEDYVAALFELRKAFRLEWEFGEIWTKTEEGHVPTAGFYGVCGID